jgi:predicted permease
VETLRLDVTYALRAWRRHPVTTIAAILALALGIGANSTVFSAVSGVLLRPLPYNEPDQLVMLWQDRSGLGGPEREVISPGLFLDWASRSTAVESVAAVAGWFPNFTGRTGHSGDQAERLAGASVSGAYFSTLAVAPALGRVLTDDDDRPGDPMVAVLSDRLWQRRFAADPAIVGQTMQLDGRSVEVVGVMPATFRGAVIDAEIWKSLQIDPANAPRGMVYLRALARLAPGVSVSQASAAFATLQTQLQQEDPELEGARARVVSLHADTVGPVRPVLIVLGASVGLVLLIACANVAGILLARAVHRRGEIGVRVALGADRGRLMRQMLTESGVLAVAGAVIGLGLAALGIKGLVAIAPPSAPQLREISLDAGVLMFTAGVAVLATLIAGLVPAISGLRGATRAGFREGGREVHGSGGVRRALVIAEVAVAMTLVIGAGLFVKSLMQLQAVDLGYQPAGLLVAQLSPPRGAYQGEDAIRDLLDRTLARAAVLPGVDQASVTSVLPLSGNEIEFTFSIAGRPEPSSMSEVPVAAFRFIAPTFVSTMGMSIRHGRDFSSNDHAQAPKVALVNESVVRRYWDGRPPLGQRLLINGYEVTIVGVLGDVRHSGPAVPADAEVYIPYQQMPSRIATLVLRTSGDPAALSADVRAMMHEIDPLLPLAGVRPMSDLLADRLAQPRFMATLVGWFAAVAAFLAVTGVYGLLVFSVNQRTREIGVRMAFGASRPSVVLMVVRQSMVIVVVGVVLGIAAGVVLSRAVAAQLFEVAPGDPSTVVTMAALMVVAGAVASYFPARRASRVDPVVALRNE